MNKLVKKGLSQQWGEDPHLVLSAATQSGDAALVASAREGVLRQYRLRIRAELELNEAVISVLKSSRPARSGSDRVRELLTDAVHPDSADLFEQVLLELLDELEEMRGKPGSIYLVDTDSGKATLAIRPEHVYRPPDFVGEDGKLHKSAPIVHPSVSAPLIQRRHELGRVSEAISRGGERAALALQHLKDPDSVRAKAVEELETEGVSVGLESPARTVLVEFGMEQLDGALQSLNPRFHRSHVFGLELARKVMGELGGERTCRLGDVEQKTSAKKRWYAVRVGLPG